MFNICCGPTTRTGTYDYESYEMPFLQSAVHRFIRDTCLTRWLTIQSFISCVYY
nr:MAG TPA: hypothetical protein [Crassvirales sp.]